MKSQKDIEYLDEQFPKEIYYKGVKKPESKLREEAMVLLALARREGYNQYKDDVLKIWKDWIKKFEGCAVFTYSKGTDERVVNFNPSEIVWNKEFKEYFTKKLKEMKI